MYSQKRHKSWLDSNKKSNRRYSLLESKSSSLENHNQRGGSFSDKKMVRWDLMIFNYLYLTFYVTADVQQSLTNDIEKAKVQLGIKKWSKK